MKISARVSARGRVTCSPTLAPSVKISARVSARDSVTCSVRVSVMGAARVL